MYSHQRMWVRPLVLSLLLAGAWVFVSYPFEDESLSPAEIAAIVLSLIALLTWRGTRWSQQVRNRSSIPRVIAAATLQGALAGTALGLLVFLALEFGQSRDTPNHFGVLIVIPYATLLALGFLIFCLAMIPGRRAHFRRAAG